MIQEVDHPSAGKIRLVGPPVKFSGTPPSVQSPPPLLGQHTREILTDILGYSQEEIEDLYNKGVI
jgi:succinate---hydroxymethylglutarate CoA-transferase